MKTAVVILNWNTKGYLHRFLPALIESCGEEDAEVVVADNASTDGSIDFVKQHFPSIRTISLDQNYGFTGGYNRALNNLEAEYFVLINSDIEVDPSWLHILTKWMDTHPECGICGPKILSYTDRDKFEYAGAAGGYIDHFGYPFCRGRILGKVERDTGQYDTPENVLWVSGACLMVRASLWKELGGFDERFFAHMEELDLCWRAQLTGHKVQNVPQSEVYHIGGGTLANDSPWKLKLNFRNNLMLLENNLPATIGSTRARIIIFARMFLDGCSALAYLLTGRSDYMISVLEAHKEFRTLRRGISFQKRKGVQIDGIKKDCIFARYLISRV